jgi:hypothetical protein
LHLVVELKHTFFFKINIILIDLACLRSWIFWNISVKVSEYSLLIIFIKDTSIFMWIRFFLKVSWRNWSLQLIFFLKHILRIILLVIWRMITWIILNAYFILVWILLQIWSLDNFSLFDQLIIIYFYEFLTAIFYNVITLFYLSNVLWVVSDGHQIIVLCLYLLFLIVIKLCPLLDIFQILLDLSEVFWVVAHWY